MRKLLALLLLPIVAFTTMGAAALHTTADIKPASIVQVAQSPATLPLVDAGITAVPDGCTFVGCSNVSTESRDNAYAASLYLPTNRWTDMMFHSRLNWWQPVEASNASASRASAGLFMNLGNATWKLSSDWSRTSMDFTPLNSQLGFQIDKVSGVIGNAITGQPVLFALIITFLLVVVLWRAMKRPGTRPFGKLFQSAVVFGLIMMMGTQAAAGTAGQPTDNYVPRAGSPVWVAGAVTGTIDKMASTAVAAVMEGMLPVLTSAVGSSAPGGWSCAALIEGSFRSAKQQAPTAGAEAVARAMNAMWISTAYNTYAVVQFGDSNPFAKDVACRQLERQTGVGSWSRARMLSQPLYGDMYTVQPSNSAATTPFASMDVPMLQSTSDNEANDAALMAWAACAPTDNRGSSFTVRPGWSDWITPADCSKAFAATDAAGLKGAGGGVFNIADTDAVREKTDNAAVLNYVSTLHGRDTGTALGSITSAVVFFTGALIAAGVFGLMSLAVFASKIFMLLLVAAMFIILVVSLFKNESMGETMRQPAFRFLGVTIFAFGSTLLLALLATVSLIIASLASIFGSAGSIGAMVWVSFSPLVAVIAVHFLFTKLFKMPSPVTAKGALAWGTAGGAVGGAVGAGLVSRMQNRGAGMARSAGRKALASNKYTSWMVGSGAEGVGKSRRGAGDAGSRKGATELGSDLLSKEIIDRTDTAHGVGPTAALSGDEKAAAAEKAAHEATKYLSKDRRRELARDAKKQWREENPSALGRGVADLKNKLTARNEARAAALGEAVAGGELDEQSMLSATARGKVGLINRPGLESFLMAPGEETSVSSIPGATWADLSTKGKVAATKAAAAKARAARDVEKTERARQAKLRRDARAAANAGLPPLSDRALNAVKAGVNTVGNSATRAKNATSQAATAAWTEAKTRSLEFRANPAGATLDAASATMDAARKASYATVAGVDRARQAATEAARSSKGRAALQGTAAAAGLGLVGLGNPVVGAVVVAGAASKAIGQTRERGAARRQAKQTQLHEIIAARANSRKLDAPSTSIVSDSAPVQRPRD